MRRLVFALTSGIALLGAPALAQDRILIPEKRLVLSADTDLPGSDLQSVFNTTLDACQAACLADDACVAFTFNSGAGACFPKSAVGEPVPYEGALSGPGAACGPGWGNPCPGAGG